MLNRDQRRQVISDISSNNNKARKAVSVKQFEVYQGRIEQYIKENLLQQYNHTTVREMPIVSTINVQRKIVQSKASVYKHGVTRNFTNLTEDQKAIVDLVYKDMMANIKLCQSNKCYIYQEQSIGQIVPVNGKLIMRVFNMHSIDAIPNQYNPDMADGFIISVFDRGDVLQDSGWDKNHDTATGYVGISDQFTTNSTEVSKTISTSQDYQRQLNKYIVWEKDSNYMMDGNGDIIDPVTNQKIVDGAESPLADYKILPFFEASREKDFEFFVRPSNSLTDFTIQYNARMTDEAAAIKLQAYSVAILKCPSELQPNIQVVGPAMLLKLPTDDPNKEVDFQFAAPSTSIGEISQANDKFLNNFLTSEGLTSAAINSGGQGETYASALDRYIAILDRMEAHQDDYEVYKKVEEQCWNIIKAWLNTLNGTDKLDRKYWVGKIPDDSEIEVTYEKPKMIRTESEMLADIEKKLDLGLMDKIEAIMRLRDVSHEQAEEIYNRIKSSKEDEMVIPTFQNKPMVDNDKEIEDEE